MQPTGQPAIVMDAVENNIFKNDAQGIVVQFNTGNNEMTIKQGDKTYLFAKDK
jgi:hypothetical protein